MKKTTAIILLITITLLFTSCIDSRDKNFAMDPQITQMRAICELAVMDCYFHNVAKFSEEDADGFLWWKKDKHFWIEYDSTVAYGIDISLVNLELTDNQITITIPEAQVLRCSIDKLSKDSYIVDKDSAKITADDEIYALSEAQTQLEESAAANKILLTKAQQRVQLLLEEYVKNIGNAIGKEYSIKWNYVDTNGVQINNSLTTSASLTDENTQASPTTAA